MPLPTSWLVLASARYQPAGWCSQCSRALVTNQPRPTNQRALPYSHIPGMPPLSGRFFLFFMSLPVIAAAPYVQKPGQPMHMCMAEVKICCYLRGPGHSPFPNHCPASTDTQSLASWARSLSYWNTCPVNGRKADHPLLSRAPGWAAKCRWMQKFLVSRRLPS